VKVLRENTQVYFSSSKNGILHNGANNTFYGWKYVRHLSVRRSIARVDKQSFRSIVLYNYSAGKVEPLDLPPYRRINLFGP
jgi:hypothetical protein